MKRIAFLVSLTFLISISGYGQKQNWSFDPDHTSIKFTAVHMGLSEVSGNFKEFSGKIIAGEEDFTDAEIDIILMARSIDTDNDIRDKHLKSEDFFYIEEYPEIKFKSTSLKQLEGNNYKLTGQLTIRDVTKTETFDVVHRGTISSLGKARAGFKVTGTINRFDYNVDWSEKFAKGLIVSEEINIICDVELVIE